MIFNGYLGYARLKNDFKPIIAGQFQQVINEIMADGLYIGKSFVKNGYVWSLESTPESPGMAKLIGKIERIRIDH